MTTDNGLAVGLGMPRVRLTEPTRAERRRFNAWLDRHLDDLYEAWKAAEQLARVYDRIAVITSDGDPTIPAAFQLEIDVHTSRWEAARWSGQTRPGR